MEKRIILLETTSQELTSALSAVMSFARQFKLLGVYFHFDAAVTSVTCTVTKNANAGANYDIVLDTTSLTGTDLVFRPTGEELFLDGDEVGIDVGASAGKTVYVAVYIEEC